MVSTDSPMELQLIINSADSAEIETAFKEYEALIAASPKWLRWLAGRALEGFHECVKLSTVDDDLSSAAGTRQLRIRAQLSDECILLLAALRAGNGPKVADEA